MEEHSTSDALGANLKNPRLVGLMIALSCGVFMALTAVSRRVLKDTPTSIVLFYYTVGSLIITGIWLGIEACFKNEGFRFFNLYTGKQILIALAASGFACGEMIFVTLAYQSDSSGFVALLSYMNIVYAYICD